MIGDEDDRIEEQHLRWRAKAALRKQLRALRAAVPVAARRKRSAKVVARLVGHPEFQTARTILAFSPNSEEVDIREAARLAREAGKVIALPRVDLESDNLAIHIVSSDSELTEGAFGIHEPAATAPLCAPLSVDLVLVPGLVFDERGFRIGYGRGFYDRLLPSLLHARRHGIAFDFQLVAEVPNTSHDERVHVLLTDEREIECRAEF